jgi:hypothetical protein
VILFIASGTSDWQASVGWRPVGVKLADIVCLYLLIRWYKQEGKKFISEFRFNRKTFWKDLLVMLLSLVIGGPLSVMPNILLSTWLFGDPVATLPLLVEILPHRAIVIALVLFPLGQALTEIPMNMRYILPRLEAQPGLKPWMAVGLVNLFLSLQHITAPLVFDIRFIL